MERWRGPDEIPAGWGLPDGSVVTIGFFDGVHLGHRRVVRRAVELAHGGGSGPARKIVVLTFDPHPGEIVRPGTHPALLTTLRHRMDLMESLGVDAVLVLPFTAELSKWTPEDFVRKILVERLRVGAVVVGENFRFGHMAAGTVATLVELGARYGFAVEGLELATTPADADRRFSSTDVRRMVLDGDVATAAARLARPHRVEGVVVRGAQRGREMGFPTANLDTPEHTAIPADGVYAGWLVVAGEPLPAAISIGTNPTFEGTARTVEAYAIGRTDLELYGQQVAVDFLARIRGMEKFDSMEALIKRMDQDVAESRELIDGYEAPGSQSV
jgi:riboflavin kinase / FMN adenylyltransferase